MPEGKKYYWLKLKRDFFKRHDVQIVESMPNGKDYVLFYLKLLVESIDHEGGLRFSETIPYDEHMLSTITNTNIDIVRQALKVLSQLELVSIFDDQTIYMTEVQRLIGGESWSAERVRKHRNNQLLQCNDDVTSCNVEIEKEIDKEKEINTRKKKRNQPAKEDPLSVLSPELAATMSEFIQFRKAAKKPMTPRAIELALLDLRKLSSDEPTQIAILNQSISRGWTGLYQLGDSGSKFAPKKASNIGNFEQREYPDGFLDSFYEDAKPTEVTNGL